MKYFRTFMLLILSWIIFFAFAFWFGLWIALSLYVAAGVVVGVLLILFPKTFLQQDETPFSLPTQRYSTSLEEIKFYLESVHSKHRIRFRKDTYRSKRYGETTRFLLYSHSLTLQDWISIVEFFDLDKQGWRMYTGRNGSYGLKKYERA